MKDTGCPAVFNAQVGSRGHGFDSQPGDFLTDHASGLCRAIVWVFKNESMFYLRQNLQGSYCSHCSDSTSFIKLLDVNLIRDRKKYFWETLV